MMMIAAMKPPDPAFRSIARAFIGIALAGLVAAPLGAQEAGEDKPETPKPPVTVEAVLVDPANPGPDTLCKLRVRLESRAERSLTAFGFEVRINGTELPVYRRQRYLETLDPGETLEIALFNFWSSETGRPARKDGSLSVEVTLIEARWVKKTMDGEVPVWTLEDTVEGLPSSASAKRPFKSS
jgi:hypothetical protein